MLGVIQVDMFPLSSLVSFFPPSSFASWLAGFVTINTRTRLVSLPPDSVSASPSPRRASSLTFDELDESGGQAPSSEYGEQQPQQQQQHAAEDTKPGVDDDMSNDNNSNSDVSNSSDSG